MDVKIVAISDTHEQQDALELPEGDILIHAGDITYNSDPHEIEKFGIWLRKQPFEYKIVIAGNHDFLFESDREKAVELLGVMLGSGVIYLQDSAVTVRGLKIYGAPWQPRFFDWAFNVDRGQPIQRYWDLIPNDIDVLVTHGPPHGILDETLGKEHVGCESLRNTIDNRLEKLKLHVFGHIHPGHGMHKEGNIIYGNASICNEKYKPVNAPLVIEL
jgi:Icc-related predicted phosphoesterase